MGKPRAFFPNSPSPLSSFPGLGRYLGFPIVKCSFCLSVTGNRWVETYTGRLSGRHQPPCRMLASPAWGSDGATLKRKHTLAPLSGLARLLIPTLQAGAKTPCQNGGGYRHGSRIRMVRMETMMGDAVWLASWSSRFRKATAKWSKWPALRCPRISRRSPKACFESRFLSGHSVVPPFHPRFAPLQEGKGGKGKREDRGKADSEGWNHFPPLPLIEGSRAASTARTGPRLPQKAGCRLAYVLELSEPALPI